MVIHQFARIVLFGLFFIDRTEISLTLFVKIKGDVSHTAAPCRARSSPPRPVPARGERADLNIRN
jgi:hypothetical protein